MLSNPPSHSPSKSILFMVKRPGLRAKRPSQGHKYVLSARACPRCAFSRRTGTDQRFRMGTHGVSRTSRMGCPQRGIESVSLGKRPMGHPGRCLVTTSGSALRPEGGSEVSARETVIVPAFPLV
jgi:hypothetical protein